MSNPAGIVKVGDPPDEPGIVKDVDPGTVVPGPFVMVAEIDPAGHEPSLFAATVFEVVGFTHSALERPAVNATVAIDAIAEATTVERRMCVLMGLMIGNPAGRENPLGHFSRC